MTHNSPRLILTMAHVDVSLEVRVLPGRGYGIATLNPLPVATFLPTETADALATWLDDTDDPHTGVREYTHPTLPTRALNVRKRLHSLTGEELVEVMVVDRASSDGAVVILNYPQTRALVAFLQN